MANKIKQYFPMIRTRESIMEQIEADRHLKSMFEQWGEKHRQEFLNFCTGIRGVKPMYDFVSKEILNPETVPERIDELLSLLLGQEVHIVEVLPGDNTRIADEASLVIMDIVVQLKDGSIREYAANAKRSSPIETSSKYTPLYYSSIALRHSVSFLTHISTILSRRPIPDWGWVSCRNICSFLLTSSGKSSTINISG